MKTEGRDILHDDHGTDGGARGVTTVSEYLMAPFFTMFEGSIQD